MSENAVEHKIEVIADIHKEAGNKLVVSYLTLRNLIGFSGFFLPIFLIFYSVIYRGGRLESSISDYYYTDCGDVFVVILSAISIFLITYNGYDKKEKLLTNIAAIAGLGTAFFPTNSIGHSSIQSRHRLLPDPPELFNLFELHFVFAILFFLCISIITLVYFPKTNVDVVDKPKNVVHQKNCRNRMYRCCGWIMIGCIILLGLYFKIDFIHRLFGELPMVFILETIAILAFGLSWITKGQSLWPDDKHYITESLEKAQSMMSSTNLISS